MPAASRPRRRRRPALSPARTDASSMRASASAAVQRSASNMRSRRARRASSWRARSRRCDACALLVSRLRSLVGVGVAPDPILDLGELAFESSALGAVGELEELERVRQRAHAVAIGLLGEVRQQRGGEAGGRPVPVSPQQLGDRIELVAEPGEHPCAFVPVVRGDASEPLLEPAAGLRSLPGDARRPSLGLALAALVLDLLLLSGVPARVVPGEAADEGDRAQPERSGGEAGHPELRARARAGRSARSPTTVSATRVDGMLHRVDRMGRARPLVTDVRGCRCGRGAWGDDSASARTRRACPRRRAG